MCNMFSCTYASTQERQDILEWCWFQFAHLTLGMRVRSMTPVFAAIKYPSHITPILLIPFSPSLSNLYVCGYKLIIIFLQSSDLIYFKIYTTLLVSSKVDLKCSSAIKVGFCLPFYETMRGRSIKLVQKPPHINFMSRHPPLHYRLSP